MITSPSFFFHLPCYSELKLVLRWFRIFPPHLSTFTFIVTSLIMWQRSWFWTFLKLQFQFPTWLILFQCHGELAFLHQVTLSLALTTTRGPQLLPPSFHDTFVKVTSYSYIISIGRCYFLLIYFWHSKMLLPSRIYF